MKNFLYKHGQRVIGGVWSIILVLAVWTVIGIIDPELASDYFASLKKDFKN